ncbi:MAG: hypothetical protein AAF799_23445 [Myxococcota bacterium]
MASLRFAFFGFALVPLFIASCFNPPVGGGGTETDDATTGGCTPNVVRECTCPDGAMGLETCVGGIDFSDCQCDALATTTTDATADETAAPECLNDEDCADQASECVGATCDGGVCVVENLAAGTACGDSADGECDGADTCDGRGACSTNVAADGVECSTCEGDVCSCVEGACGECPGFAATNEFLTPRSIAGWELEGGWGLFTAAPATFASAAVTFTGQVFGTDGNRVSPYPGAQLEASLARTRPTVLPAELEFQSWHVDEGGIIGPQPAAFDSKRVSVSTDGGETWTVLADCSDGSEVPPAFCGPRLDERSATDWDAIALPVPPELVGEMGIVEFAYDTLDECCDVERGWYIDSLNFATECDCISDAACAAYDSDCGIAECFNTGACAFMSEPQGTKCGDATSSWCDGADTCNSTGQCLTNVRPSVTSTCEDCASGSCTVCEAGTCGDCSATVNEFDGPSAIDGWTITSLQDGEPAGWGVYPVVPRAQNFDPMMIDGGVLQGAPALGNDGNRVRDYPGAHVEESTIVSPVDVVPETLTFDSWHVDEGGSGGQFDTKIIEISTDGGADWETLVNCTAEADGTPFLFCLPEPVGRAMDDWDPISIDLGPWAGQMGQLRLTYSTGDSCCGFERGWFIDNLNFAVPCD